MDTVDRHRALYKGTTPPWKETYRKRCVERLRNSRTRLLEKYRQMGDGRPAGSGSLLVHEVMELEWDALRSADRRLPSLWRNDGVRDMYGVMQENDELSVLEDIQQELLSEEQLIIAEYEKSLQYEQQYLSSVVEEMDDEKQIICPVCRVNNLTVTSHFISCRCGVYINTKNRNITKENLQSQLENSVTVHMEECFHSPVFSVASGTEGSPNLLMSCKDCDHLSIIL